VSSQLGKTCAVQPKKDTDVGAHFGRAGQALEMDLESELIGQVDRSE